MPARVLAVIWTAATIPWLTWIRTIPYDAKDEFYPGVAFTVRSLLGGEAPFWNPFLYAGYPSFADPQAMTFSPSVVLPMLVSQSIVWFDIVILLHLLFGGLGMLRLGRSYGWTNGASLITAMIFMFGGVASSRLQHTPMIVSWSFLPWIFVAMRALFRGPSWRVVVGLGLAVGLATLQLTQVTYLSLVAACAYAIYRLVGTAFSEGRRPTLAIAGRLAAGAIIALLIAAPQLIATMTVLPYTNRAHLDLVSATANSLSPKSYLTLISPNVLGNLAGTYIGPNDITETYLYLGALPLAILVFGLLSRMRGPGRGESRFWALALLFSVLYALGSATPVFAWLHGFLPGMAFFRRPTDAAFLSVFCAAVLIGATLDAQRGGAGAPALVGGMSDVRVLGVIVCLLLVAGPLICASFGTRASLASLALLAVGFLCFVRSRTAARPGPWIAALVLSIFVDLRVHNLPNRLNAHRAGEYAASTSLEHNSTLRLLAQRLREDGYYRIELRTGVSELNAPEAFGIASIGGLNPLVLRDYIGFVGLFTGPFDPRGPSGTFASYDSKINDLLGVRYLAAADALRPSLDNQLGPGYRIIAELDGRSVWQNQNALPRVLRPRHAISAPPLSAFKPATLDSVDLETYVYVEASNDILTTCADGRADHAEIVRYSNNEVVVAVETSRAAWITLNDVYLDGWRAEIAGVPIPIYRANGIFRAVCVPSGAHSVRFVFEPYRHWSQKLWAAVKL